MTTLAYNIAQLCLLVLCWPLLLVMILLKDKYRKRIPDRLGRQLSQKLKDLDDDPQNNKTFWVHALSVGEVTSAVPLVKRIRDTWPKSRIVVTVTTTTGEDVARRQLTEVADVILSSPIDLLPIVHHYVKHIRPDIYIQVETDFWPNLLSLLRRKNIPALLVNGRISQKSLSSYKKFSFFFAPMFQSFSFLAMQSQADAVNMGDFGVTDGQLRTLGNLKFDIPSEKSDRPDITQLLPADRPIFVAGSTHAGEEEILFSSYRQLRDRFPDLYLVLVPRNPNRAEQLKELAATFGFTGRLRSSGPQPPTDLLIVDTIGELIEFYRHADIAFVGGSLVPQGGHNPIEPAIMGVPVIYGPHMEDFHEIADALDSSGGGRHISGPDQLNGLISGFLANPGQRKRAGSAARACIINQQGVVDRHIDLIASLI